MKIRSLLAPIGLVALGLFFGSALTLYISSNSSRPPDPKAKNDQALAHIDFEKVLATVGEGKWTLVQIPNDSVREFHTKLSIPKAEASLSTISQCYVARSEFPVINVDQERGLFNKLLSALRTSIDRHAVTEGGGSIGTVPLFPANVEKKARYYGGVIHFYTIAQRPHPQTHGGLRGTATVWLFSDGITAALFVSFTEVTKADG